MRRQEIPDRDEAPEALSFTVRPSCTLEWYMQGGGGLGKIIITP